METSHQYPTGKHIAWLYGLTTLWNLFILWMLQLGTLSFMIYIAVLEAVLVAGFVAWLFRAKVLLQFRRLVMFTLVFIPSLLWAQCFFTQSCFIYLPVVEVVMYVVLFNFLAFIAILFPGIYGYLMLAWDWLPKPPPLKSNWYQNISVKTIYAGVALLVFASWPILTYSVASAVNERSWFTVALTAMVGVAALVTVFLIIVSSRTPPLEPPRPFPAPPQKQES